MSKRLILAAVAATLAGGACAQTRTSPPKPAPAKAKIEPAPIDPYAKARKAQDEYFRRQAEKNEADKAKARKEEGERWLKPSEPSKMEKAGFRFSPFGTGSSVTPGR